MFDGGFSSRYYTTLVSGLQLWRTTMYDDYPMGMTETDAKEEII